MTFFARATPARVILSMTPPFRKGCVAPAMMAPDGAGPVIGEVLPIQWKELPIEKDRQGRPDPEIHYTRIYRAFRRWQADGCFDAIFEGSVFKIHQDDRLDITVIHGDGTTTGAKKGGDNLGFSGHKKLKGDKVVAFCDWHCNVIAPFVAARGNRNEYPLLPELTRIARAAGLGLRGTIVRLDV